MTRHLYLHAPRVVARGQVNFSFDPDTDYPAADIPILVSEVLGDADFEDAVKPNMTVIFGSAPGRDDRGRQRVRKVVGNETLYIGYSPRGRLDGEIDIAAETYWRVLDDRRVWAKTQRFVRQDVAPYITIFKDYDMIFASHGSGTLFYPKANAGPARAGTIDPDTGKLTVSFDASHSYSVPEGVGLASYLWDVGDGTITGGTASDAEITADFPAGFRYIALTVTDADGLHHTMEIPVLARDPAADICVAAWQELDLITAPSGQRFRVRLLSDAPASTYYDGTPVLYFDDDDPDHHCLFYGWHHHDPASLTVNKTGVVAGAELECLDILGKLDTLPGQAVTIRHAEEPANWGEMYHPTMYLYIDHLVRWHSNALDLADWSWPALSYDFAFIERECDADTFYRQVQQQARAIVPDQVMSCNTRGQLQLRTDPQLQPLSHRTDVEQADITPEIAALRVLHQRPPRVREVRASAMIAGWTPVEGAAVEVRYTVRPTGFHDIGATMLNVYPLPAAIPAGTTLYLVGLEGLLLPWVTVSAAADADAESISVAALTETVEAWDELVYVASEPGPSVIPTAHAIAPGLTHGQGETAMTLNDKIALTAGALMSMVGMYYARVNAEYGLIDVELRGQSTLGIEPADLSWVTLGPVPPGAVPPRWLPLFTESARYLPLEIQQRFEHRQSGTLITVTLRLERETFGPPAVAISGSEV